MPTITLVDKVSAGSSNNTSVTTGNINTTGAKLLVAHCATYGGVGTITDSKSNSPWIPLTANETSSFYSQWSYIEAPIVGSGHNFTCTAGGPTIHVFAFTVDTGTLVYDSREAGQVSGAGNTIQASGALTPSTATSVSVSGIMLWDHVTSLSVDGSFAPSGGDAVTPSANNLGGGAAYLIQTSASAINPTWTVGGAFDILAMRNAIFKAIAGGGGGGASDGSLLLLGVGH